ncbi:hypothetical protein ACH4UV_37040 [Streptomyces sp. NPDC020802]
MTATQLCEVVTRLVHAGLRRPGEAELGVGGHDQPRPQVGRLR